MRPAESSVSRVPDHAGAASWPALTAVDLDAARVLVGRHVPPTPQREYPLLSARLDAEVWVKHENHAPTGAFKVRGGLVALDRIKREHPEVTGVISATRGNHGQSLAFAARMHGLRAVICVPQGNSVEKNAAMRGFGAELIEHGRDFDEARVHAEQLAARERLRLVRSFHPDLVLGVATYAHEFLTGTPPLDVVYVPIGMGSSICAMIAVRDLLGLPTEIVGVQAAGAPSYYESFRQGGVVTTERAQTLADGLATRVPDPQAVAMIRRGANRVVLVDDAAIGAAIAIYFRDVHTLAEGAGAAPLAAALQERERLAGRRVGLVLSGGNIDLALFHSWTRDASI